MDPERVRDWAFERFGDSARALARKFTHEQSDDLASQSKTVVDYVA
jgi:hypothetical protein